MPRPSIIRLREDPAAAPGKARVIEADFKVVGRRSFLGRVLRFLGALFLAALIGALVPPGLMIAHDLAALFAD